MSSNFLFVYNICYVNALFFLKLTQGFILNLLQTIGGRKEPEEVTMADIEETMADKEEAMADVVETMVDIEETEADMGEAMADEEETMAEIMETLADEEKRDEVPN